MSTEPIVEEVMTREDALAKIRKIASEQFGTNAEITEDTNFATDLDADSLDLLTMVMGFEEEFGTTIPDDKVESLSTVRDVIDFLLA